MAYRAMGLLNRRAWMLQATAALGIAWTSVVSPASAQQAYPVKPIRLVVPFAAGGPTDVIARLVAERMTAELAQPVVVENRPGAGTILGAEMVAKAPKDGYTLLLGTTSTFATNPHLYRNLSYSIGDFVPIALLGKTDWVLTVNNNLPIRTIPEFVEFARARPGVLNYGMMGVGSSSQFVGKMLESGLSIRMTDIPYKGSGPALADLMGGQVQVYVDAISTSMPLHRAGKVRVIGVMAEKRAAIAPDIPTFAEAGFPEVIAQSWYGLFAPSGTPRSVVDRLHVAVQTSLRHSDLAARLTSDGVAIEAGTPDRFAAMIRTDSEKWGRLIVPLGVKLD